MAEGGGISGVGVVLAATGLYLMYAGIRDVPLVEGLRELAGGQVPTGRPAKVTGVSFTGGQTVTTVGTDPGTAGAMVRPVPGRIGDAFGVPRPGGRTHKGVDLISPMGTPIRAAMSGTVTGKGYDTGAGNYINLSHSGGPVQKTKYFHLSAFNVAFGQNVTAGQVLGLVGSTGNSSGPHLHFEVWVGGKAVDPAPYLSGGAVSV